MGTAVDETFPGLGVSDLEASFLNAENMIGDVSDYPRSSCSDLVREIRNFYSRKLHTHYNGIFATLRTLKIRLHFVKLASFMKSCRASGISSDSAKSQFDYVPNATLTHFHSNFPRN